MASDIVNVPVDEATASAAARVLGDMGVSLSEGVRLLLADFLREPRLPFRPNATTIAAMENSLSGDVVRVDSVEALFADLDGDDAGD